MGNAAKLFSRGSVIIETIRRKLLRQTRTKNMLSKQHKKISCEIYLSEAWRASIEYENLDLFSMHELRIGDLNEDEAHSMSKFLLFLYGFDKTLSDLSPKSFSLETMEVIRNHALAVNEKMIVDTKDQPIHKLTNSYFEEYVSNTTAWKFSHDGSGKPLMRVVLTPRKKAPLLYVVATHHDKFRSGLNQLLQNAMEALFYFTLMGSRPELVFSIFLPAIVMQCVLYQGKRPAMRHIGRDPRTAFVTALAAYTDTHNESDAV